MSKIKFFFNHECVPADVDAHKFQQSFEGVLIAYDEICSENAKMINKGIVTEKTPSDLHLAHGKTVSDLLEEITNTALKTLAFSYFSRYPIENHLKWEKWYEEAETYETLIAGVSYSAMFAYMVAKEEQFGLTTACLEELEVNQIRLQCKTTKSSTTLDSLFGSADNKKWVQDIIDQRAALLADNWEKLHLLLGELVLGRSFEKDFKALSREEQESILTKFEDAKKRNLKTPLTPDTKIIKEVSADEKKPKVCELRVYRPVALRVYFYEKSDRVYLASIEKKSSPNQNSDIKKAQREIEKLLLTNP